MGERLNAKPGSIEARIRVGKLLRTHRLKLGKTLKEIAAESGVSPSLLIALEEGRVVVIDNPGDQDSPK